MRINVYEEELTDDVQIVTTEANGRTFYGVRMFLESTPKLHNTAKDDDRSAVTLWVNTQQRATILHDHLRRDLNLVVHGKEVPTPPRP